MTSNTVNPTTRFSSRVDNYVKYRPGYPRAILDLLRQECGLAHASTIADIGSGTGNLSRLFLENGNVVFGVEPNREMREAAEAILKQFPAFSSVPGSAEATALNDASVDFVTAGQAFHWFDRDQARREFLRILKPGGWVVLIWNEKRVSTPFLKAYDELLLANTTEYAKVDHRQITDEVVRNFFGNDRVVRCNFENRQVFDFEGLKGRHLSSSYVPEHGPAHDLMLRELESLFRLHQTNGVISFEYLTLVYSGQL